MPRLAGFSDNAFRTRADVARAAEALLKPLIPYFSVGDTHITIPWGSGAHFDETAAALEGYARPLWIVGSLLAVQDADSVTQHWITGLRNGVDPSHESYWGAVGDLDQRMVEAEILSFALLAAPQMYTSLDATAKDNLKCWLMGLNGKMMPENNWRFFRILSNLALIQVCGVPRDEVWHHMESDLAMMESFYMCEGWSSDGLWRPVRDPSTEGTGADASRGRSADYYSGSFAIQFSQLLYSKYAAVLDPERCALFRGRARDYARSFCAYFDDDGMFPC